MTLAVNEYAAARHGAIKVHPVAELFPMASDQELTALAIDIKMQGLLVPIVLDEEGMLIDGRNRLRACELAGVDPRFARLKGHDPIAFIFAQKAKHKVQAATVTAKTRPAPPQQAKRRGKPARAKGGSAKR